VVRPDQHDVTESALDQPSSAQKKRPNKNLAQFSVGLNEPQKLVTIDFDHFARLADAKGYEGSPAGEHRHLACELAGQNGDDGCLTLAGQIQGFYSACDDYEEFGSRLPGRDEHFAALDTPHSTMHRDPLDLLGPQLGESLVDVRCRP
jgi:hypothetical protein